MKKQNILSTAMQLCVLVVVGIGAAFSFPWRLVVHTRWGERALIFGGPAWALLLLLPAVLEKKLSAGTEAIFVGIAGEAARHQNPILLPLLTFIPFFLLWLARLIYIAEVEPSGPRPHSWSMGYLPGLPEGMRTMALSNLLACVVGLWFLAFGQAGLASSLFCAGVFGQIADFAVMILHRWKVLDARDEALAAQTLGQSVEEDVPTEPESSADFTNIFA